jgi:hypothetical protein
MIAAETRGQVTKHDITFVVRKPDRVKNIASRFHVTMKELKKINRHLYKNDLAYQGKLLTIPVWLKPRTDMPHQSSDFSILDYAVDVDSLDQYINEDFLSVAEIEADTVRRVAIDKQIRVLTRKIAGLNARMDSIEAEKMQSVSNKEVLKIQIERARHRGDFMIGNDIDTLTLQKKKLSQERARIDIRVADYENLMENAPYMATHSEVQEQREIQLNEPDPVSIKPVKARKSKTKDT